MSARLEVSTGHVYGAGTLVTVRVPARSFTSRPVRVDGLTPGVRSAQAMLALAKAGELPRLDGERAYFDEEPEHCENWDCSTCGAKRLPRVCPCGLAVIRPGDRPGENWTSATPACRGNVPAGFGCAQSISHNLEACEAEDATGQPVAVNTGRGWRMEA